MKRMTTDDVRNDASGGPIGNMARMLNYAYAEDGCVKLLYAGGTEEANLCECVAQYAKQYTDCAIYPCDVQDGACLECDCPVAILNIVAIQAAELRARLMMIEDILGEDYDLEQLRELVKTERRWIPVTERLPEDLCPVLVSLKGLKKAFVGRYQDSEWWSEGASSRPFMLEVTHWMPQPSPPKEV